MEAHQLLVEERAAEIRPRSRTAPRAEAVLHRCLDVAIATITLLLLAPAIAVIAAAVKLSSPGPVLFRQQRLGRERRTFTMLKFRTMQAGADSAPHREYTRQLITGEKVERSEGLFKLAVDNRVTPVGRLLRRWSLDEVPQLVNVLLGQMSLVGPRPVLEYELEHYPEWYLQRFAVKPGLTGLWQVSGRNERTYDEMVRFDVEYAEDRTLRLDVVILIKTVWVVLRRKGVA
jgi:lipopolysaccharide/colanic/teichoic acid biosynthesis glycosyltransferase